MREQRVASSFYRRTLSAWAASLESMYCCVFPQVVYQQAFALIDARLCKFGTTESGHLANPDVAFVVKRYLDGGRRAGRDGC